VRRHLSASFLVLAGLGCATEAHAPSEGRPPAFIGTPGPARPDGCQVLLLLSRRDRPSAPIEDIATVSAEASNLEECKQQLVLHEACRYGGDVLYVFESGQATLGLQTPLVWCAAKVARWLAGAPPAR
jgi:hypothetical protein